jgi:HAD superfamily hydrolase (TIGR01450 family)
VSHTFPTETTVETESPIAQYLGVICDLDGVVYRGATSVRGAVETLNRLAAEDIPVVFATNNASRSPEAVGDHFRDLGVGQEGWAVVTSSQAAATYLAHRLPRQTPVCAVGGPGVARTLSEAGLCPVRACELDGTSVAAVVQGLGVDVSWRELAEVGYLVEGGATWVVTNLDRTLPTSRGPAPGNGALVAAVQTATTARPHVVGKPGAALFDLAPRWAPSTRRRSCAVTDWTPHRGRQRGRAGLAVRPERSLAPEGPCVRRADSAPDVRRLRPDRTPRARFASECDARRPRRGQSRRLPAHPA